MDEEEEQEDLLENIFFVGLKENYPKLYDLAERKGYVICVPQSGSFLPADLTKDTFETHILQPSPYYKYEYVTLNHKTVDLEGDEIALKSGFSNIKTLRILFEESFYKKNCQPLRVLCIEEPLVGGRTSSELSPYLQLPSSKSYPEVYQYLRTFPEHIPALVKIDAAVQEFNQTYFIVKGFESHTISRVLSICKNAFQVLIEANPEFKKWTRFVKKRTDLQQVIESYVVGGLHRRLWGGICVLNSEEDEYLYSILKRAQNVTQSDLGIKKDFQTTQIEACYELRRLDSCQTAYEKLQCLQKTNHLMLKAIQYSSPFSESIQQAKLNPEKAIVPVATDDLLPTLVYVIITSKSRHLRSNIAFMEMFTFSNISSNAMGFQLVTFQAAVEFLKGDQFSSLIFPPPPPSTPKASSQPSVNPFESIGDTESQIKKQQSLQNLTSHEVSLFDDTPAPSNVTTPTPAPLPITVSTLSVSGDQLGKDNPRVGRSNTVYLPQGLPPPPPLKSSSSTKAQPQPTRNLSFLPNFDQGFIFRRSDDKKKSSSPSTNSERRWSTVDRSGVNMIGGFEGSVQSSLTEQQKQQQIRQHQIQQRQKLLHSQSFQESNHRQPQQRSTSYAQLPNPTTKYFEPPSQQTGQHPLDDLGDFLTSLSEASSSGSNTIMSGKFTSD